MTPTEKLTAQKAAFETQLQLLNGTVFENDATLHLMLQTWFMAGWDAAERAHQVNALEVPK